MNETRSREELERENAELRARLAQREPRLSAGWGWPVVLCCLAGTVSFLGILACGIPFVQPFSWLAIVCGAAGLLLTARAAASWGRQGKLFRVGPWLGLLPAMGLGAFALFLGWHGKHLIDFLEGH